MGRLISTEVWDSLLVASAGHGMVRTRVAPEAPIDIFVAVEKPSSTRLLFFGLADAAQAQSIDVPQATGIEVRAIPSVGEAGWGFAEVRLVDARYVEVFTSLADDLVVHVADATNGAAAIEGLADRLRRWEAFLKVVEPEGLGQERRAGLYGELHVLRAHLLPISKEMAVATWVGPEGAHQDFQGPDWALEVKTSRTKEPVSVRISGERQLDDLGLGFLGLAHIGLEQRRNSGETLPEIVASVRAMLVNSAYAETFEAQLLSAGYLGIHEPRYLSDGYVIRFDEIFEVSNGFPRIIERDLVDGVGDVAYSVAVSSLGDFRTDWTLLTSLMKHNSDNA